MLLAVSLTTQAQEIFDAVKNNDLSKVKTLVEKDVSIINLKDKSGNTLLHEAAYGGSLTIVEFLIFKGADINSGNTVLDTPLHLAISNGRDDVAILLIEKGADLNKQNNRGTTPLHETAYSNNKMIAELLISKGVDLEIKNKSNYTPLAALTRSNSNFEVAEVLVRNGANINAPWTDGSTPLYYAALYSDDRIIDLLLDHKADFDTTQNLRYMIYATASRGHLRLFKTIVDRCGDALFKDENNNRALMRNAIFGNSLDIVKILQSKNILLDVSPSITGATPLHSIAAKPEALEMIEFLVENGADINAKTNDGRSAYNIAEIRGNKEVLTFILELGGNSEPQKFPVITGSYMGQVPPGDEPKRFAPGIVYSDHSTVTISPDGNEMYWGNGSSILFSKIQNGQWTKPDYVSFSRENNISFYDDVPFVSPDNKKLFFTSRRPIDSRSENSTKENIWYVERTSNGWSEPKAVSAEINALSLHWQVSVSNSGTLYFGGSDTNSFGLGDIYYSKLENGVYSKPVNLGSVINSEDSETMPYIAPDETYLIFYRIVMQRPSLYISFKTKDGQWMQPKKIEQFPVGNCGIVSPDGKYFFCDNRWVTTKFIEDLKPKGIK